MSDLDLIETDRLVLSGWRPEQAEDLYRLHSDPTVALYISSHGKPWSKAEMDEALVHWMALFQRQRMGKLRVTRKSDGVFIGRCGFGVEGPEEIPEIGFSLFPEFWGQGYAFEAAAAVRDWYWRETERLYFIGVADPRNDASLRVLRKLGGVYTHSAKTAENHLCEWYMYNRPAS